MKPSIEADNFYSPGRLKILLWRYDDLVRLVGSGVSDDTGSQRTPRQTPEGGFEAGASLKADLDWAMMQLDLVTRRIIYEYYIAGYPQVSVARHIAGCNRWVVRRSCRRGIRQMAESLHWTAPKHRLDGTEIMALNEDDEGETSAELHEKLRQIVARGLNICPRRGPPGYACPVINCRGFFDVVDGEHVGERIVA